MKINMINRHRHFLCIAGLVVLIDQITKAAVLKILPLCQPTPVIPGFFSLTRIHNPGGAFGFMANQSSTIRGILFLFVSAVSIIVIYFIYKNIPKTHTMLKTGLALVFGGAIGNIIDRFRFGYVVDFLDFYINNLHWPAFNAADSAITIGIAIFIFHTIFDKLPN